MGIVDKANDLAQAAKGDIKDEVGGATDDTDRRRPAAKLIKRRAI